MVRLFSILGMLISSIALAQTHTAPMSETMSNQHMAQHTSPGAHSPSETGQAAFAAIQEIVIILEEDPKTDWTKVNIEALRQHLIDMNNVTILAKVTHETLLNGIRYTVTGDKPIQDSIRRMVMAHAATMNGVNGWNFEASETEQGAVLTVIPTAQDKNKLQGLGFIGVMTRGMHHQAHHLALAQGENPH